MQGDRGSSQTDTEFDRYDIFQIEQSDGGGEVGKRLPLLGSSWIAGLFQTVLTSP